jgi:hypothetical protein
VNADVHGAVRRLHAVTVGGVVSGTTLVNDHVKAEASEFPAGSLISVSLGPRALGSRHLQGVRTNKPAGTNS